MQAHKESIPVGLIPVRLRNQSQIDPPDPAVIVTVATPLATDVDTPVPVKLIADALPAAVPEF